MQEASRLSKPLAVQMAACAAVAVTTIYSSQPLLDLISASFSERRQSVGLVPVFTQLGFALGLLLLVPLGDLVSRRKLILIQFVIAFFALLASAWAPTFAALVFASVFIGLAATITQQLVPFAVELAAPSARGRAVAAIMSGAIIGMLGGRVFSGAIGEAWGWRTVFAVQAILIFLAGLLSLFKLPTSEPTIRTTWFRLMTSMIDLIKRYPALRRAALIQGCLFGAFSAFWTVLALRLAQAPFHAGSLVAGSFGLVGIVGAIVTPMVGRQTDRRGPHAIIGLASVAVALSFIVFQIFESYLGIAVGIILLDVGMQTAMVANQSVIYSLDSAARSRINTVYMIGMFLSGAVGSAGASLAWNHGQWPAVCAFGGALGIAAACLHLTNPARKTVADAAHV